MDASYGLYCFWLSTPFSVYHRRLFFVSLFASAYSVLPSIAGGLRISFIFSDDGETITLAESEILSAPLPASAPLPPGGIFTDKDTQELERMYDNAQYIDFLSCECFRRLRPNEIPLNYMEKEGEERVLYLPSILRVIFSAPTYQECTLESATQTLILSVFVDTFSMQILDDELVKMLFPEEDGPHRFLINLINHHESCSEKRFLRFLAMKHSPQLLERCVALIWGELADRISQDNIETAALPQSFLRLLAWIVTYCDQATLEAVIDFPSMINDRKLSRTVKRLMLLRSLPNICELTEKNSSGYNLGTYLANYLYQEYEEYDSSYFTAPDITQYVSDWKSFSQRRFQTRKPDAAETHGIPFMGRRHQDTGYSKLQSTARPYSFLY